ncbi:hypothetical protein AK51_12850 [Serratia nematodiphila DZ0503SBS1]|nr:hypothetical protein AK51_12850 [Serratia nematodiphila DZ0503SBS1]
MGKLLHGLFWVDAARYLGLQIETGDDQRLRLVMQIQRLHFNVKAFRRAVDDAGANREQAAHAGDGPGGFNIDRDKAFMFNAHF